MLFRRDVINTGLQAGATSPRSAVFPLIGRSTGLKTGVNEKGEGFSQERCAIPCSSRRLHSAHDQ